MQTFRHFEASFAGSDATPLFRQAWIPPSPNRVLVLVHGLAEHSGRHAALAQWFAQRCFAVHAYDHRGHGRSLGRRGFVRSFSELLDDLECFLVAVKKDHPTLPITLLGHSLGGLVVLTLLCERSPELAQAVVSGPALRVADGVSKLQIELVRQIGLLLPWLPIPNSLNLEDLSRDPEVGRRYREDPLVQKKISIALARAILEQGSCTLRAAAKVQMPILILHGAEDRICSAAASQEFFRTLRIQGSACKTYPGLRHEVFQEPEHEKVYNDVLRWIESQEEKK